jgi:hypothetical protein
MILAIGPRIHALLCIDYLQALYLRVFHVLLKTKQALPP